MDNTWSTPPNISAHIKKQVLLGPMTWLRAGGKADIFVKPENLEELRHILECLSAQAPLNILGAGSNVLIRDKGLRGLTVKLGKGFRSIQRTQDTITAGAACALPDLSLYAAQAHLNGLAFYIGIPGTVGGAIRMNAGAHKKTTGDVLLSCTTIDRQGRTHFFQRSELTFQHRHSSLPEDHIVLSATFKAERDSIESCKKSLKDCLDYRDKTQPKNVATCGCLFKNPEGHYAWKLVQNSGVDIHLGRAQMSTKHANFLVNMGKATASELEALIEAIEKSVQKKTGIKLSRELKVLGDR